MQTRMVYGAGMTTTIQLHRSDAMSENHNLEPAMTIVHVDDADGDWVQITYESIRAQDGTPIITWDDDAWWYDDQPWSDIIIRTG